ncbi:MAG: PorP/SprF family type IX secretion system membrane protein, partial [Bacteroidota bacterium]
MKKLITNIILCCFVLTMTQAQDPSFSQFYANRIYLNPAFTGLDNGIGVSAVSRLQWIAADRGFRTYSLSAEVKRPFIKSGFGIQLLQDEQGIGDLTNTSVGLSYSYTIPLRRFNEIKFGLQGRVSQKSVNWSQLVFSDQLDPVH